MCARHDVAIGRYLLELEAVPGHEQATILLYLTIRDMSDGDEQWKGCVRFTGAPTWEADTYGGSPLLAERHADEVPSA